MSVSRSRIYNSLSCWEDCGLQDAFSSDATSKVSRRNMAMNIFGPTFCGQCWGSRAGLLNTGRANSWMLNLSSAPSAPPSGTLQTVWRKTSLSISRKRRQGWHHPQRIWSNSCSALFHMPHLNASRVKVQAPRWGRELWFAWPQIHFVLMVAGVKIWPTSHSQKEADKAKQKKKSF